MFVATNYIALAAGTIHSTQWSQILAQNRDFCLPHTHSTPPLGRLPSEYCHAVCYLGLASGLRRAQNRTAWRTLTWTATSPTSSDWWWYLRPFLALLSLCICIFVSDHALLISYPHHWQYTCIRSTDMIWLRLHLTCGKFRSADNPQLR